MTYTGYEGYDSYAYRKGTFFQNRKFKLGLNLNGAIYAYPEQDKKEYLKELDEACRIASNDWGISIIRVWFAVPLTKTPKETPEWRRDYTIVKNKDNKWVEELNDNFFKDILLPFHLICKKYNIIPNYCLTGYTREIKFPYVPDMSSLYSQKGADFYCKVLKKTIDTLPDKDFIITPTNEPHTYQVGNREAAIRVNYEVVKFHALIVKYGIENGLKEENFEMNFEEGFNEETGERSACYPMAFGAAHFRHRIDITTQSFEFLQDESKWNKLNKDSRTWVIFNSHRRGKLEKIIGRVGKMTPAQSFTGLFCDETGDDTENSKYRRFFSIVGIDLDGYKVKEGRLYGDELYDSFMTIAKYSLKWNIDRACIFYLHPDLIYDLMGNPQASHLHTIVLKNLNKKYCFPATLVIKNLYGEWPENYGKFKKEEPEVPIEPEKPIEPEVPENINNSMSRKDKIIIAVFGAAALICTIIGLVKIL